jgi:hypothetical protein
VVAVLGVAVATEALLLLLLLLLLVLLLAVVVTAVTTTVTWSVMMAQLAECRRVAAGKIY